MTHCKDCIYFEAFTNGKTNLGRCHLDPPVILQASGNSNGVFPLMSQTNWCGQAVSVNCEIGRETHDLMQTLLKDS